MTRPIISKPDNLNHTETIYFCLLTDSFTELEGVERYRFTSGRNYISRFERAFLNGGRLHREREHAQNGTSYYRYSIGNRQHCEAVINAFNQSRQRRQLEGLGKEAQAILLAEYD